MQIPLSFVFKKYSKSPISAAEQRQTYLAPPSSKAKPSKLARSRNSVLPTLLVLIFTTLILGIIYGYCVSKKHTNLDSTPTNPTSSSVWDPTLDGSYFKRQYESTDDASYAPLTSLEKNSTIATNDGNNAQARATEKMRNERDFSTKEIIVLTAYTATLPLVSMSIVTMEILLHFWKPSVLDSRFIHIVTIACSGVLAAGWIVNSAFWLHCELPGRGNEGICPVQVRGHFMYGIHELSIAKAVMAFAIVFIYLAHAGLAFSDMKAKRRVWALNGKSISKEEIFVIMEEGKH